PATVVALRSLEELTEWSHRSGRVTIGAGLPYADMEKGPLAQLVPALAQAARTVGSPQIRAAGTIGGNLGTCSPAGDTLPVLAALNATIHVLHRDGVRDVPFSDFMVGVKRNCLRPGEIVHSVTVPVVEGWQGYAKVGTRNAMVISTASACLVHDAVEGLVSIALGAVGPTIIRATEAESWLARNVSLRGSLGINSDIATEFGRRVAAEARPISDHRSTADYRRHAISVLARRLLERAAT
ncbi:MAG: FAD binding domain-containing protein, partial [Ilumatobacteraceae bacterium]